VAGGEAAHQIAFLSLYLFSSVFASFLLPNVGQIRVWLDKFVLLYRIIILDSYFNKNRVVMVGRIKHACGRGEMHRAYSVVVGFAYFTVEFLSRGSKNPGLSATHA
jgi:hypothetical protein